jgi:hypothetical protein
MKNYEKNFATQHAWVFHTSFENGSCLKLSKPDPFTAIGTRMLYQLLPVEALDQIEAILSHTFIHASNCDIVPRHTISSWIRIKIE